MADMTWHRVGYAREVYANTEGKILGEVSSNLRCSYAYANGTALGEYIDTPRAKRAVERAIAPDAGERRE